MPTLNKLEYLNETKQEIKSALNTKFNTGITDEDTFRSYVTKITGIYNSWPKVTGAGTEVTLNNCKKGKMMAYLKGNTSQTTYTGKNLIPTNISDWEQGGINSTNGSNASSTVRLRTKNYYPISNDIDYHISINGTKGKFINIHFYDINYNYLGNYYSTSTTIAGATGLTINISSISYNGVAYMRIVLANTNASDDIVASDIVDIKPMIELGTTTTDFEPYVGGIASPNPDYPQDIRVVTGNNTIKVNTDNYTLNLGTTELCKIGDYQDYIYKENDKWYKHSEIDKRILDGNESNWSTSTISGTTITNRFVVRNILNNNFISNMGLCDKFINRTSDMPAKDYECLLVNNNSIYISINISRLSENTINAFKTWLNSNNVKVYYVLSIPTTTEITDTTLITQLEALNNAMAIDGTNNISSEYATGNAPVIISASALMKGGN